METFLFVIHILSALFLIGIILLQKGQGADIGAAFGGASSTVFGSRGPATFLNKMTIAAAVIFLGASLILANIAKDEEAATVVDTVEKAKEEAAEDGGVEITSEPVESPESTVPPEATE